MRGLQCPSPEMLVEDAQCFTAVPSLTPHLPGSQPPLPACLSEEEEEEDGGYYTMFLFH